MDVRGRALWIAIGLLWLPGAAAAYPGGTPTYVTDVAPYCAGCHSSVAADQFAGVPEARVQAELADKKHLARIRAPADASPYAKLGQAERAALVQGIQKIDQASSIRVAAPARIQAGQVFEVTATATGGGGPVIGIALVDSDQRWQARPAPSAGWFVVDAPRVTGPDGNPQTRFTDGRNPTLAPGIAYVNVYDVSADLAAGRFASVSVTWRLRAPATPGSYPLGAVFLYGTEKGAPHGLVESVQGKLPLGGMAGSSGRVRFSELLALEVQ
jgi:hypothetical protein